jgi:NodT family efflux transporter outer membrane factor (OMF) lipoprotein
MNKIALHFRHYTKILCSTRWVWLFIFVLAACEVGPEYVSPDVAIPNEYKETKEDWKKAEPQDDIDRGEWWKIFEDARLNDLMQKLNASNQNIAAAEAQYRQAKALVDQARAGYAPQITGSISNNRNKSLPSAAETTYPTTTYTTSATATWEPDLWGSVKHAVEASQAGAEATAAQLALTRLSMQASMAQYYFQLCTLDLLQKVLESNVDSYKKLLDITKNRHGMGVASLLNIVTVESQLQAAEVMAVDNGVARAQYEHAIAVLIGQPVSGFSLPAIQVSLNPPVIPPHLPAELLERRPDIAQAERQMAVANAQIGAAMAAFYPTFSFSASGGFSSNSFAKWLSAPAQVWSLGPQLAASLFDGGLLRAKEAAARASYDQSVALYRQTILSAFQDVEDNLVSLRLLEWEVGKQTEAVASAQLQLKLVTNEYVSGTAALADVVTAQINAYTTQNTLNTIIGRRMVASVGLVKALGGGWNKGSINIKQ